MPLINRIEVSNFMNRHREDPWRPDWPFQVFDLKGENTAINIGNGRGKSTIALSVLALLAHDRTLNELRLNQFAPASTGHFSHIRLETYIWADDDSPVDLIAQSGGDFGGYPVVFGAYGNAGESSSYKVYSYRGTFEDCPIGRREGNRVTLIPNADFLEHLSVMPGRFPATQRDDTRANWREFVSGIFDMPGIEQQLVYQKAKGAEGSSGYFEVKQLRGRSFSEAVFYERLAPELLVDMMGHIDEFADERGIEDTIHQKVQGIIKAKARTAKTADDLEKTRHVLEELERVKKRADVVITAKEGIATALDAFSLPLLAMQSLVIDDPLPGMPRQPDEDTPELVRAMVMQRGEWFLPDRAFEAFTDEKPSAINQRAERLQIQLAQEERAQAIEIACDLKIRDARGNPSKLYNLEAARAWINATANFKGGHSRDSALQAVDAAFAWVGEHGDTNPARLERQTLRDRQGKRERTRKDLLATREKFQSERESLLAEQTQIGEQQAEHRRMTDSGLFTSDELAAPAKTGVCAIAEREESERALSAHQKTVAENKSIFTDWQTFAAEHGDTTDTGPLIAVLEESQRAASAQLATNQSNLSQASQAAQTARNAAIAREQERATLSARHDRIQALRPLVAAFRTCFGDENPDGLAKRVQDELKLAERRLHEIAIAQSAMRDALVCLQQFHARHGAETDPKAWLDGREAERLAVSRRITDEDATLKDLSARRADLDRAAVAPGKVAREVLAVAGGDAMPLHAAVEAMGLADQRKAQVLSLFSALIFSPVYASATQAATAASTLAANGIEAPVFVADELEAFCRTAPIAFDGTVARTWLVGVRTRPVDCLLDPSLVEREKAQLDEQIAITTERRDALRERFAALSPESEEAIAARKAREAIDKGYVAKDAALIEEVATIEQDLPRLRERASVDAADAIRAMIDYLKVLAGDSETDLEQTLAQALDRAQLAAEQASECESAVVRLSELRDTLHAAANTANLNASRIPRLRQIQRFIDNDGPTFMREAPQVETQLAERKRLGALRAAFRFDLAESFIRSGDRRPLEIEQRLGAIKAEVTDLEQRIPSVETELTEISERLTTLEGVIVDIDALVRELRKKYRELISAGHSPTSVPAERLMGHPLIEAATEVRRASSPDAIAAALQALTDPLADIEATLLRRDLDHARKELDIARNTMNGEIERVKQDSSLALNEQMRIGLEQSKTDINELLRMIEATTENFNKSLAANNTARTHLDEEWGNIGSWLENFTRRLPSNFDAMRSAFRPVRDSASGEIVSAGFEIEARIADMKDVRLVLEGIVTEIERSERSREALGDNESLRATHDKDMRRKIREEFYRNVIIDPRIRVCIPSISRKALLLEKNMASSGQGVAMTLLWIVKMADYVTERELRRQTASHAARKRLRSMRTQFVIIDGAFSHLSDKRLITDALNGVTKTRGKFQLIITGHDPNYRNDYAYFPTYIVGREIGNNLMYADSETRRLQAPEEVGSRNGAMELASWHKMPEHVA